MKDSHSKFVVSLTNFYSLMEWVWVQEIACHDIPSLGCSLTGTCWAGHLFEDICYICYAQDILKSDIRTLTTMVGSDPHLCSALSTLV